MKLELCTENYWEFVRTLRMDERVIDGFIQTDYITPEMQVIYMKKYSDNYRIAVVDETPAGFIGVIDGDIRICTHPDFQKSGVGKFMLNEAMKIWPNAFGKVKIKNEESIRLFESCGFQKKYYIFER